MSHWQNAARRVGDAADLHAGDQVQPAADDGDDVDPVADLDATRGELIAGDVVEELAGVATQTGAGVVGPVVREAVALFGHFSTFRWLRNTGVQQSACGRMSSDTRLTELTKRSWHVPPLRLRSGDHPQTTQIGPIGLRLEIVTAAAHHLRHLRDLRTLVFAGGVHAATASGVMPRARVSWRRKSAK